MRTTEGRGGAFKGQSPPDTLARVYIYTSLFDLVSVLYMILYFQGTPLEEAKKILLMCLNHMKKDWTFNILVFGSSKSYYQHINTFWSCTRGLGNTYKCKGMILAC